MSERLYLVFVALGLFYLSFVTASGVSQCYTCHGISCLRTTAQEVVENCTYNLDVCVTIFEKFAVKAKGCLLNMPVELRDKCDDRRNPECQICSGNLCNNLGRRDFKCYECSEKDDANCLKNITALRPVQCKIPSAPNSYCFTEVINDGSLRRGCSLHVKDQKACLASNQCTLCSVEDVEACNTAGRDSISSMAVETSATIGLLVLCVLTVFKL